MRIAIDARLNAYRQGGIPQYTRQLMAALAELAAQDEFISLQHRAHTRPLVAAPNLQRHPLFPPPHHRFEALTLPLELLPLRPDLVHFPDFIAPRLLVAPAVVTIHDLAFLRFPEILDDAARAYYGRVYESTAAAAAVIAVSKATRDDLVQLLGVPPERIDVVYEAAPLGYWPLQLEATASCCINGHTLNTGSFLLFVSTLEPRKNLPTLLQALQICRERRPDRAYRLVIAGARGWRDEAIFTMLRDLRLGDAVDLLGSVAQHELCWLYSACRIYANPSLYEGFGLPLLEAMSCGAACLAADTASLPEIGADAALYLPPLDAEVWADTIEALWDDEARRQALGQRGIARAAEFSWQRAARETLAIYRRVA
ncbi:MAG TPA: glycosyltransferase family 1 protein [Roseiflexaceae bacterium]|nr:glycosyltransferase family 1 protein [Roseiflexaceae bacterium]